MENSIIEFIGKEAIYEHVKKDMINDGFGVDGMVDVTVCDNAIKVTLKARDVLGSKTVHVTLTQMEIIALVCQKISKTDIKPEKPVYKYGVFYPEIEREVYVWNAPASNRLGTEKHRLVIFGRKNGKYLCWNYNNHSECLSMSAWQCMEEI